MFADFSNTPNETGTYQSNNPSKKARKLIKKVSKNIFK